MDSKTENFEFGIHIERQVFTKSEIAELKTAFYETLAVCREVRVSLGVEENMANTVHHVLFEKRIFQSAIENERNINAVSSFFQGKKFILNSLGGQNNVHENYARNIHRDVRFYSVERLMLNSIWCLSPINSSTGATEFMIGSDHSPLPPTLSQFEEKKIILKADPGDIVYFDSRIWHRAGRPGVGLKERIIFTPIYSRPFIKPGFNYAKQCASLGPEKFSDTIRQLSSYYSDIPETLPDWYGFVRRRFYHKDQD